jgi:hypothetical protein
MSIKIVVGVIIKSEDDLPSIEDLKFSNSSIETTVGIDGFMVVDLADITLKAISLDECSRYHYKSIDLTHLPLYVTIESHIDSSGALVRNIVADDISNDTLVGRCIYNHNGLLESMLKIIKIRMTNWVKILLDLVTGDFSFSYLDLKIIDCDLSEDGAYEIRSYLGFDFGGSEYFTENNGVYIFENTCIADSIEEDVIIPSGVNKIALRLNNYDKSTYSLVIPPSVEVAKFMSYSSSSSFRVNLSPLDMYVSNANSSIILNALRCCLKTKDINYSNTDDLLSAIHKELKISINFY